MPAFRSLLRTLRPRRSAAALHIPDVAADVEAGRAPWLPPAARAALPDATAEEAITYNRVRKAVPIALYLLNTGATEHVPDHVIDRAARSLTWPDGASPDTRAAVRATLAVLRLVNGKAATR
ncbi:hypothetical protein [Actinacidiphila glaucinigra]|uniref:hypothetical protein n=1 Tax=Actinacidiphila glaucinigra TaxID=235986 RepID=UPI003D9232BD